MFLSIKSTEFSAKSHFIRKIILHLHGRLMYLQASNARNN